MKIVPASFRLMNPFSDFMGNGQYMECMVKHIEKVGRICYKSEDKITDMSYVGFVKGLIKRGHEAMLEHSSFSVRFIVDRGISHEIVRHRLASFAQESTRYCNYNKGAFGGITYIRPLYLVNDKDYKRWYKWCGDEEKLYTDMIAEGYKPEQARAILSHCVKTEVVMTANFREWRHFFKLRALEETGPVHPQMLEVTEPLLEYCGIVCPVIFDDLVDRMHLAAVTKSTTGVKGALQSAT